MEDLREAWPALSGDERGLSEMVSASLTISLALLAGVGMIGMGAFIVDSDRGLAAANELEEDGQQVAGAIESVDRLVRQSESSSTISQTVDLPETVADSRYQIEVLSSADAATDSRCGPPADTAGVGCLVITASEYSRGGYPVVVYFTTNPDTSVVSTTVSGGPLRIVREAGAGETISVEEGSE